MNEKETKVASVIEVEAKQGGFVKIYVQSQNDEQYFALYKKVKKELATENERV